MNQLNKDEYLDVEPSEFARLSPEMQKAVNDYLHPPKSEWTVYLLKDVAFVPNKGSEPNRFHRLMQRLLFGIKWVKE